MAYAIIQTGGKQVRVEAGTVLEIDDLTLAPGASTAFNEVLMVSDGTAAKVGEPLVAGASVQAEVLGPVKGDKVVAYKFRRRKGFHRTVGHRQKYTRVKVTAINA